jgi:hypothetical protein
MGIATHEPNNQVVGQQIVKTKRDTSVGVIVTFGQAFIVDIDKISIARRPDAPATWEPVALEAFPFLSRLLCRSPLCQSAAVKAGEEEHSQMRTQ